MAAFYGHRTKYVVTRLNRIGQRFRLGPGPVVCPVCARLVLFFIYYQVGPHHNCLKHRTRAFLRRRVQISTGARMSCHVLRVCLFSWTQGATVPHRYRHGQGFAVRLKAEEWSSDLMQSSQNHDACHCIRVPLCVGGIMMVCSDRFNHALPVSTVAPSKSSSDSATLVTLTHDPAVLTLPEADWQHQACGSLGLQTSIWV